MSKSIPQTQPDPEAGSDVQRWTAKRKAAVVIELIKGKSTAAEVARQHSCPARRGALQVVVPVPEPFTLAQVIFTPRYPPNIWN